MATAKETLFLEGLLAKEGKNYLPLVKLKATELKKFGLKSKPIPTALELKHALGPFLGDTLMLADKGDVLCLAKRMSQENWTRLLDEEKHVERKKILDIQKDNLDRHRDKVQKSYMPLKLKPAEWEVFGLKSKPASNVAALEAAITPYLDSALTLLPKAKSLFLAYKKPLEEFIKESIQAQKLPKSATPKAITDDVPIDKNEFIPLFIKMLTTGCLQITGVDGKFCIMGVKVAEHPGRLEQQEHKPYNYEEFYKAFEKWAQGGRNARICNMRRELGWTEEQFNTMLGKLRKDGTIQLHPGDSLNFTMEEIKQFYTDEYGSHYATLTWKKQ